MAVLLLALWLIPPTVSMSTKADQHRRQIKADTLRDVFELILAPLLGHERDSVPIDCANGKVARSFAILAVWIADHMENVALNIIKSIVGPRCELPAVELATNMKVYSVKDYPIYHN